MKLKITVKDDEYRIQDVLSKINPNNKHYIDFRGELLCAVQQYASENGYDLYVDDYLYELYPVQIVFIDNNDKETTIEDAVDWIWKPKQETTRSKKFMTTKEFYEKYDN